MYDVSNGADMRDFTGRTCDRCVKDAGWRDNEGDSCPILMNAIMDGECEEWSRDSKGVPSCTAFDADGVVRG